jgi:hypothetical protein
VSDTLVRISFDLGVRKKEPKVYRLIRVSLSDRSVERVVVECSSQPSDRGFVSDSDGVTDDCGPGSCVSDVVKVLATLVEWMITTKLTRAVHGPDVLTEKVPSS